MTPQRNGSSAPVPGELRRRDDQITIGWIWRQFVPLLAVALAAYAVIAVRGKADSATARAKDATEKAALIQESRRQAAIDSCLGQNSRHDQTVAALKNAPVRPDVDKRIILALIEGIAPRRDDCVSYAAKVIKLPSSR